jgi:hypothetical protein
MGDALDDLFRALSLTPRIVVMAPAPAPAPAAQPEKSKAEPAVSDEAAQEVNAHWSRIRTRIAELESVLANTARLLG